MCLFLNVGTNNEEANEYRGVESARGTHKQNCVFIPHLNATRYGNEEFEYMKHITLYCICNVY